MAKPISHGAFIATMVAGVSAAHLLFIAATVPAMGEETLSASHTVQFREASFTCGDTNQSGKVVRFMRATPASKFLPEYSPSESDPLAKTWDIIYRNICERDANMTASVSHKHR